MSKYDALWAYVGQCGEKELVLSYEQIERIAGCPVDHSFLKYKKELLTFGYEVKKISMKEQTIRFGICETEI